MSENEQYEFLWGRVREILRNTLSPITYNTYISKLVPADVDGTKLVLKTDTEFFANFIGKNLADKMKEAFRKADTGLTDFALMVEGSDDIVFTSEEEDADDELGSSLDPKYTFESFVAGKSNEFVFAAAKAVAKNPGADINPLYIYGASGLGKTHLLQSIANYLSLHKPGLRVLYTTCEKFINELIDSIYLNRGGNNRDLQARFRSRYRGVDVLLIDDVQFLAKKQAVQEELFHTFNALQAENKQIVLTSDVPPKEIATLEERLRTRFEGGLIADIQPPDTETKIAILKQKAFERKVILPTDVAEFLARDSGTDVRTLEGRLTKLLFAAKLHEEPISLKLAKLALSESVPEEQETVTPEAVIKSVCSYYKISKTELLGKNKKQEIVRARQICAYLMCEMLSLPLVNVGKLLARDHATIIHSRDKIADFIKINDRVAKDVDDIKNIVLKQ